MTELATSLLWLVAVVSLVMTDLALGRRIRNLERILYGSRPRHGGRATGREDGSGE